MLLLLPRQRCPDPLPRPFILWTLYEKGGDTFAVGIGEPDDLGFLEAGGGRGLEEEGGDHVPHG